MLFCAGVVNAYYVSACNARYELRLSRLNKIRANDVICSISLKSIRERLQLFVI